MIGEHWDFEWDHIGWEFDYSPPGGSILLTYDAVRCSGEAEYWRHGEERRAIPWPWPQHDTPHDPAEVIAMCRRLAGEHLGWQP